MKLNTSYVQKCKTVAHVFQIILIFIAGCITIAVLTKGGATGGATKFYFALCFLSAPAIIYLVMVPMWSRAERFANAYAFAALDGLYTILWLAAFASVMAWNAEGVSEGAKDLKLEDGAPRNCTIFKYGPEAKCSLSRVTVGFGAVIFVSFILTTAISGYYANKFRKEGIMPYQSAKQDPHHVSGDTSKDNAWSTEIEHHDGRDSDEEDRRTERGGNQEEDEYALLHSTETDEGRHPGRPLSWGEDHRVGGPYRPTPHDDGPVPMPYAAYNDDNNSALSPGGYEDYRREGTAKKDSSFGGSGYSFSGKT
ncbi:hypothetical protein GRF29_161g1015693 [Pseudopithomyces chartarum]|uniref:MARVEL domain-containing protein n=1 Tax=Pseudopithomyces chartarum TaxID=1892770 RepID=A0AAN6RDC0_9PLEO|nr:hypothetical protein GRF29_161g1015693 [Pseudopithomyces chartarum]